MSTKTVTNAVPSPQGIEPIEAWQIISVERSAQDDEPARWGRDGRHVVAWFDLGEVRHELASEGAATREVQTPPQTTVRRVLVRLRNLFAGSPRYRFAQTSV